MRKAKSQNRHRRGGKQHHSTLCDRESTSIPSGRQRRSNIHEILRNPQRCICQSTVKKNEIDTTRFENVPWNEGHCSMERGSSFHGTFSLAPWSVSPLKVVDLAIEPTRFAQAKLSIAPSSLNEPILSKAR